MAASSGKRAIDQFEILYSGSVKKVRAFSAPDLKNSDSLIFEFTDQVSVFDWGALPDLIPGKGKSLVKMGALFFEALASPKAWQDWYAGSPSIAWVKDEALSDPSIQHTIDVLLREGLKSHYRGVLTDSAEFFSSFAGAQASAVSSSANATNANAPSGLVVEKVKVIPPTWVKSGMDQIPFYDSKRKPGELIPLEVVFRFKLVPGSSILSRRKDLKVGDQFEKPLVEFFSKLEPQDRFLNPSESLTVSGLSPSQYNELILKTQLLASFLQFTFSQLEVGSGGIDLIDGKFEWALSSTGELMIVDSIGPDELRILKEGRDLSKETLREFYRTTEWYKVLQAVKAVAVTQGDSDWKKKVTVQPPNIPTAIQKNVTDTYEGLANQLENLFSGQSESKAASEKVILIGSGGREHAIADALLRSPQVRELIWPTQNLAAILHLRNRYPQKLISLWDEVSSQGDLSGLVSKAQAAGVTFAVVGPDAYLEAGTTDLFLKSSIPCFGPTRDAAKLEWSKSFAKEVMNASGVPTAKSWSFTSLADAKKHLAALSWDQKWVLKVDTLAAGKGVEICTTLSEAERALDRLAKMGEKWIIEEFLQGKEVSIFAFCDGETAALLDPARDFKTLNDDHQGPNTGGMGAISPVADLNPRIEATVLSSVFQPMLDEMKKRGTPYHGLLYAGLMIDDEKVWVLEFNARFGDPETQALLPRFQGDFFKWLKASALGTLSKLPKRVPFSKETSVYLVAASEGYPESPRKGDAILGISEWIKSKTLMGFFAGIKSEGDQHSTSGGRVLGSIGIAKTALEATQIAYERMGSIQFKGKHTRQDVGVPLAKIVVLASGRGSNFEAIARAVKGKKIPAKIVAVLGNRKDAVVFEKAKALGIEGACLPKEADLIEKIKFLRPDWIVLAGYDRIISKEFIDSFRDSKGQSTIINIHPSLLPAFKGLHAYQMAFDAKVKATGVSIHRVEPELDAGPLLAQETFEIHQCKTAQEVEALGLAIEHKLYSQTLCKLIQGEIQ